MRPAPPSEEPIAEAEECRLVNRRPDDIRHCLLDDLVLKRGDAERLCPAVRLGYLYPRRTGGVRYPRLHALVQAEQPPFQPVCVLSRCLVVHPRCGIALQRVEGPAQLVWRDMVQERRRSLLRLPRCNLMPPGLADVGCIHQRASDPLTSIASSADGSAGGALLAHAAGRSARVRAATARIVLGHGKAYFCPRASLSSVSQARARALSAASNCRRTIRTW